MTSIAVGLCRRQGHLGGIRVIFLANFESLSTIQKNRLANMVFARRFFGFAGITKEEIVQRSVHSPNL